MSATIPKKSRKRNRRETRKRNRRILRERQRRTLDRILNRPGPERDQPMMTATNIHYELADRVQGLSAGGIGAMLLLARRIGLIRDLDHNLHVLKRHLPYHESDHVLNIAFNILAGGQCLEDLELRRNDVVYLDALGARRIPDPTTEGDFCRRFTATDVQTLMETLNGVRLRVWAQQPPEFFAEAILDADGTLVATEAECKQGVDLSYNGIWGYHPLILSLANTGEPLYLVNRSGNRPSHEEADVYFDKAIALCRQAGFRQIPCGGTPTSPRPSTSTAGIRPAMSGSTSASTRCPTSRRWPSSSPPTPTAFWNDRRGMRSKPSPARSPNRSSRRSSESASSRRSICSRK